MQLQTILNRIEKHAGFVYESVRWDGDGSLAVKIRARRGSRPRCSGCGARRSGYDRRPERAFAYVPLWGIAVTFLYAPRRVHCPLCGVLVEEMPWATGKRQVTNSFSWFLARWGRRLSWKEVAEVFRTSWENVFRSVELAVTWGLAHRRLDGVEAIGIDELQWQHGQSYVTVVYQLDQGCRRLLWIGRERKAVTLDAFFTWLGDVRSRALRFVCSDMWSPYLKVVAARAPAALHILDRFHIVSNINEGVDKVRRGEANELRKSGEAPLLKGNRWLLLKRWDNLKLGQATRLAELLRANLRTVRAYLLKEELDFLWGYRSAWWAGKFLDSWLDRVMRSRLGPLKTKARSMRKHRHLILNWFRAAGTISNGIVEGFNNKARVTTRRAYGFRTYRAHEVALYHALGRLPEPESTHRFC